MKAEQPLSERRSHHRYRVKNPALVRLVGFSSNIGTLHDISRGGMGIRVLALEDENPGPVELSISVQNDPVVHVENLSCRLIHGRKDFHLGSQLHMKSCGLTIENLSEEQRLLLEKLVSHHTLQDDV